MTTKQTHKPRLNARALAVVACVGLLVNCWYRGPIWGILPFALVTVPPALLVAWILLRARLPRLAVAILAALAAMAISYFLCAPPTTDQLLDAVMGGPVPQAVRDLQRWDDAWARDPGHHLRFRADVSVVQRVVDHARLQLAPLALPYTPSPTLLSVPRWWQPQALTAPQIWRGVHGYGIELCYDPESQLAYLSLYEL